MIQTNLSEVTSGVLLCPELTPLCPTREAGQPKEKSAGLKEGGVLPSDSTLNWINPIMRIYILIAMINTGRIIRCENEGCGSYKNIEFHHTKYYPDSVSIFDLKLLCSKCHRNDNSKRVALSTVFKNGGRYCVGYDFKFEY